MSEQPQPSPADRVFIVIGSMPYEFQEVNSVWTTRLGADAEAKRLEALVLQRDAGSSQDAEYDARYEALRSCSDFWVVEHDVQHAGGPR